MRLLLRPELSPAVQNSFQTLYGALLLLVLVHQFLPNWRRFFLSDRWGGYAHSGPLVNLLHRPSVLPLLGAVWALCGGALLCSWHPVLAALINLILCHHFFVTLRWRSLLRGFGAPGFMTYWLGIAVFLLALTRWSAPALQPLAVLFLQVDIALILFSSACYKLRSGYASGEGMDYGLVNPMWGYWPNVFRKLPERRVVFALLNQAAWVSQLVGAVLMLVPETRWLGGALEIATYLFILTQIRLGWLAEEMMLVGLLFFTTGSPPGDWLNVHWPAPADFTTVSTVQWPSWPLILQTLLVLQLVLVPLSHAGLFYNYYGRRRLPFPLQGILDAYAGFLGIILWRVFSVDHLNFYVNIYHGPPGGVPRVLISEWRNPANLRFWHVGEAITVTSLFTTLKYYPSNDHLFLERILRYARTLPCPMNHELIFDYVSICKSHGHYEDYVTCRFLVDPSTGTMRREILDPTFSPGAEHPTSPVFETARVGSYAPKND